MVKPKLFGFRLNHTSAVLLFFFSIFLIVYSVIGMLGVGFELPAYFVVYLILLALGIYVLVMCLVTRGVVSA